MKARTAEEERSAGGSIVTLVAVIVLLGSLWLPLIHHLAQKRDDDLSQARRDVANISAALAEQVSRLVAGVDIVMRLVEEDYARDPDSFDLRRWTTGSASLGAIAKAVNVFDERGVLVASSLAGRVGQGAPSIADRAEFRRMADGSDAGLVVGRTYPGRVSAGLVMPLFRRLVDERGRFRGVLAVSLDPGYLTRQFASLDVGSDGSVALFGIDGFVRARTPYAPGMYDRSVLDQPARVKVFSDLKAASAGTYDLAGAFDGDARLFAYRDVGDLPLVLSVGRSRAEILAPFRHEAWLTSAFGALATVAILGLSSLMLRESRRRSSRERSLASANAALADAEADFRGLFEASPDVLYVHRIAPDGAIAVDRFNPAAAAAAGLDDSARGRPLEAVLPPRVFAHAAEAVALVVAKGETLRRQGDVGPDGADLEIVMVPLRGEGGEGGDRRIERVFVSVRDISHLRLAQEAVAASEARYRMLAETTSDVITRLSLPDFRREYVSPACRSLFGFEPEEMLGLTPTAEMHPDDASEVRSHVERFAAGDDGRGRLTVTYRARHRLGHWLWIETCMSLARDAGGAPEALVCSLRDIGERRRAEAARAASETRFRLLAENTGELIILAHDDDRRSYISAASERLLGFTPAELDEEMAGGRWLHPDDAEVLGTASLAECGETSVSCRVRRKDGAWIWIEAIVRRIAEAGDGEPTVIATLRDVSERHAQADALRVAKEAAEEASRTKSNFLATMSHEIRTPLNGILGYADLLVDRPQLDAEGLRHLDRIRNAGSALRTVVDDILDFSKLEAGQVELRPAAFSPAALLDNATSIVRGLAEAKALDLVVAIGTAMPPSVVGDHDRLRQILLNLLNNAIKFTPAGSVTLSVRASGASADFVRLRFSVEDTGIGIPEDKRPRLFQRFSQVDGSISRDYGGTGLGLAICRSLVEAMGGDIGVDSVAGRGSDFWFEVGLPSSVASSSGAARSARSAQLPSSPARILLADDQELNRDLARAVLEGAGYDVDFVEDGAAALAAVSAHDYDLVLMDVQMPVMDGVEATRCIRALPGLAAMVPIVAMTANVLPVQVAAFRLAGMDDHLGKPFKREDLLAKIELRRRPSGTIGSTGAEALVPCSAFDDELLEGWMASMGRAKVEDLLLKALHQAGSVVEAETDDRAAIATRAHAALSAAGSLGLCELAEALRALEQAYLAPPALDHRLSIEAVASALSRGRRVVGEYISLRSVA